MGLRPQRGTLNVSFRMGVAGTPTANNMLRSGRVVGTGRTSSSLVLIVAALVTVTYAAAAGQDGTNGRRPAPPQIDAPGATRQSPPPPAPVPPNRCLAVGTLLSSVEGPDRATVRVRLPGRPGDALSTLELRIVRQRPAHEDKESLCVPASTLTVLAPRANRRAAVGKRVEVELELLGTTAARRWWLHGLRLVNESIPETPRGTP